MHDDWYKFSRNTKIGINFFVENIIRLAYCSVSRPGDVVVDGGANKGVHTVPMSSAVGDNGLVVAFEAIPSLAASLQSTFSGGKSVAVINKALGAVSGKAEFTYVVGASTRSGLREQEGLPDKMKSSISRISVEMTTLDAELESLRVAERLRFVKLDLEGGEFDALRGAKSILRWVAPFIVLENGREKTARVYGYTASDWFRLFHDHNYLLFDIFGRPFGLDDWSRANMAPYSIAVKRAEDILFVRHTLPQLIAALALPYRVIADAFPECA